MTRPAIEERDPAEVLREREGALTELVEGHLATKREQEAKVKAAEEAEATRLATLTRHQEAAVAAVVAREALVPALVEKLTETLDLAEKLLAAHEAFGKARAGATKADGRLTVVYPSPFAVDGPNRHLMERARQVLGGLGGRV